MKTERKLKKENEIKLKSSSYTITSSYAVRPPWFRAPQRRTGAVAWPIGVPVFQSAGALVSLARTSQGDSGEVWVWKEMRNKSRL